MNQRTAKLLRKHARAQNYSYRRGKRSWQAMTTAQVAKTRRGMKQEIEELK